MHLPEKLRKANNALSTWLARLETTKAGHVTWKIYAQLVVHIRLYKKKRYTTLFPKRSCIYSSSTTLRRAMAQQRQPNKRQQHTTEIQQKHFDQVK